MFYARDLKQFADSIDASADYVDQLAAVHALAVAAGHVRDRLGRACADRGDSYGAIGRALGITRQAARKRYPR